MSHPTRQLLRLNEQDRWRTLLAGVFAGMVGSTDERNAVRLQHDCRFIVGAGGEPQCHRSAAATELLARIFQPGQAMKA